MKEKEKLVAIKDGITVRVKARRYPPEKEVYGTVRLCGMDCEGKPFDLLFTLDEFDLVIKAVNSAKQAVCREDKEVKP